ATVLRGWAKSTAYAERSWSALLAAASGLGFSDDALRGLRRFLRQARPDLGGEDARALLRMLTRRERAPLRPGASRPTPKLEPSGEVSDDDLLAHVMVSAEREDLIAATLAAWSLLGEPSLASASCAALENESTRRQLAYEALGRRLRLDPQALEEWRRRQELDEVGLAELLRLEQAREQAFVWARSHRRKRLGALLRLELRRRGDHARRVAAIRHGRALAGLEADGGVALREAVGWYQREVRCIAGSLDAHAAELGFDSVEALGRALITAHLGSGRSDRDCGALG
ncbi:MAG: hypothetical protein KC431_02755, partial [Myxococcales bacterium]|nr:hypothetical protein [Myxococcales bacterium]